MKTTKITNTFWTWVPRISALYGFVMAVWGALSYFNLVPWYQIELHEVNTLTPIVNLFPGQQVRLDFDLHKVISRRDFTSVKWRLAKDSRPTLEADGISPTIKLPATEGGIYLLSASATTPNKSTIMGQTNLYVVQDKPNEVQLTETTKIHLTPKNTDPSLLKNIGSEGLEIYVSKDRWVKAKSVIAPNEAVTIELQPNDKVALFGQQLLFRVKNSEKKLTDYGSVYFTGEQNKD